MIPPFDRFDAPPLAALPGAIAARWRALDTDWQAVCLGFLLTLLVGLGFRIPW